MAMAWGTMTYSEKAPSLMSEYGWKLNPLDPRQCTKITPADATGLHFHPDFAWPRLAEVQFLY